MVYFYFVNNNLREDTFMNRNLKGSLILLLTAIIWGSSFVSQKVGVETVGPMTFIGLRTLLGSIVLLPVIFVMDKGKPAEKVMRFSNKTLLSGGLACGIFLCIASTLQTFGMKYIDAGKSGFLTSLYMIFVPIIGIFMGKKLSLKTVISVFLALIGMYLLCMNNGFSSIGIGDILVLLCAVFFSFHIMVIDYFSPKVDGVKLSCLQFFIAGAIASIGMLIIEKPTLNDIIISILPIAYSGIMSCGVAYTLQIIGQKYAEPTIATLIMSLESVFAALSGWLFLNELMTTREFFGCLIVFIAVIYIQLPSLKKQA